MTSRARVRVLATAVLLSAALIAHAVPGRAADELEEGKPEERDLEEGVEGFDRRVAKEPAKESVKSAPAALGVSYGGWKGQYADAAKRLAALKEIGFQIVSFVPTYAYVGRNKIDLASGPDPVELGEAVEIALRSGLGVVVKPHLDPPIYGPGFDPFQSDNFSWRVSCPWRGFFDLDPMSDDYRTGIVFRSLEALKNAFDKLPNTATLPARLELGVELMNSEVDSPERWELLLAAAKKERHRLGLDAKVQLSHDFTHHIEILDDFVGRMAAAKRVSLRRYIKGLDALSLSQYMDLTVAVPPAERAPAAADRRRGRAGAAHAREELPRADPRQRAGLAPARDPAAAHRRVRNRPRRAQAPQPMVGRRHARAGEGAGARDRARPRGPGALPRAHRGAHRRERDPLGHRRALRHLRLGEPQVRQRRTRSRR